MTISSTAVRRGIGTVAWTIACLAAILGFGAAPLAQSAPMGAVRGTVVDEQRMPVRTATVTLKSPALQGDRTAIPRADGSYGFWQLPPGEYAIAVEAPQFSTATRTVTVLLGVAVELQVTLHAEGAGGEQRVVSETPASIAGPVVAAHFNYDDIDSLATPRTIAGISKLAPGVAAKVRAANQTSIGGASPFSNVWQVNGLDVADDLLGTPQTLFVDDAIEQTAVMSAGLTAEYGRLSGGVISAVTRSGGNRFSGSYRANLTNPRWTTETPFDLCDPAVTLPTCVKAAPRPDLLEASHEATLGGFVIKNRIWFFGGGRLSETADAALLPLSADANTTTTANQRGELKLTSSVAPGHTLTFDAATNLTTDTRKPPFGYTVDRAALADRRFPNYSYVASYHAMVGRKALVEAQFASRRFEQREVAAVSTAIVDSPILTRTITTAGSPAHYNGPYFDAADPDERNSLQGTGNVTYLMDTRSAGRHEIKGGYEFFRRQHVGGGSQSSTGYVYQTDYLISRSGAPARDASDRLIPLWVPGETLLETWLPVRGSTLNVDTQSIYATDHFIVNRRLTADLGVRHERVQSSATGTFSTVASRTFMPRLAIGYAIDDQASQVVHVTYGHYAAPFDILQLGSNSSVGNPNLWLGVYVGPVGQGRSFATGFDPANYLSLAGRFPSANVSIDGALDPPLVKEWTTSYGVAIGHRGFAQAALVSRDWSRFVDDFISTANGTTHVVRNGFDVGTFTNVVYRNSDDATRTYRAIEFQGRYELARRWTMNGSYTVQLRNEGNYSADVDAPGGTSALANYAESFNAERNSPTGRLPAFQRNRLRLWSAYDLDLGRAGAVSVSAVARVDSGGVYSLTATNQPLTAIQIARLAAAGYPDRPPDQTVFFGGRGSQDFAGYGVVDLALRYAVPLLKQAKPWVKIELYNAFDNRKLIAWDTTVLPDGTSATDALGLPTTSRPADSYGKATSNDDFPSPFPGETGGRTFRLAFGFRF